MRVSSLLGLDDWLLRVRYLPVCWACWGSATACLNVAAGRALVVGVSRLSGVCTCPGQLGAVQRKQKARACLTFSLDTVLAEHAQETCFPSAAGVWAVPPVWWLWGKYLVVMCAL
ncbi:hypothetical protein NDU88_003700 [Pleurodeles waltl]|uniref:Secreted protein n=1 Tax=Pleurodeles waltl TaxID=8319 RepID=A0AAV7QCH1_PLEWA|nr:hypothetical protein NDU88_003700 [Pleurodeles waltl]